MAKLFSILGTGVYKTIKYRIGEDVFETAYFQAALAKHLINDRKIDSVEVFLTAAAEAKNGQALISELEKFKVPYKMVNIPDGKSVEELWQIFDIISEELKNEDIIYFDITHGFRSLPMIIMLCISYVRTVKAQKIGGIYYGAYEAMVDDIAPCFNLTAMGELLDWLEAARDFTRYGDSSRLSEMLSDINGYVYKNKLGNPTKIKYLAKKLDNISLSLFNTRIMELEQELKSFYEIIDDPVVVEELSKWAKPFILVKDSIKESYMKMNVEDQIGEFSKFSVQTATWLIEHNHYLQAMAFMREAIITKIMYDMGMGVEDVHDEDKRHEIENKLNDRKNEDNLLAQTWSRIASFRNDLLHCGMRKKDRTSFDKIIGKAKKLLCEFTKLMTNENKLIIEACSVQYSDGPVKPRRMLLIISHSITLEQEKEARAQLGIDEFVMLEPNLLDKWSNIPPDVHLLDDHLEDVFKWIDKNACDGDYALVQGDYGATFMVVDYCMARGIIPVYATTQRKVKEEVSGNSIIATREFRHVMFREYKRRS